MKKKNFPFKIIYRILLLLGVSVLTTQHCRHEEFLEIPNPPTLISPINDQTVCPAAGLVFTWSHDKVGVEGYDLIFNETVIGSTKEETTFTLLDEKEPPSGVYNWKVRAKNDFQYTISKSRRLNVCPAPPPPSNKCSEHQWNLVWYDITPPGGYGINYEPTGVYDPIYQRLIILGDNSKSVNLTAFSVPTFSEINENTNPKVFGGIPQHVEGAFVYHPPSQRAFIFSPNPNSTGNNTYYLDLSTFFLSPWALLSVSSTTNPAARYEHGAVYDELNNRLLVFGGTEDWKSAFNDTWALDLNGVPKWTKLNTNNNPPKRWGIQTVYLKKSNKMMVYGGVENLAEKILLGDLWSLDLDTNLWKKNFPAGFSPPKLGEVSATSIDDCRMLLSFGIYNLDNKSSTNQIYIYNSFIDKWEAVNVKGAFPQASWGGDMVYDSKRKVLFLFGTAAEENRLFMLGGF